jgi:hypothetical protein
MFYGPMTSILDMPGMGLCTNQIARNSGGYPTGVWPGQSIEPLYCWSNTLSASPTGADPCTGTIIPNIPILTNGVHYVNGKAKPGYTPFTYPHPLVTAELGSTSNSVAPIILTDAAKLANGAFQFAFTNMPGGSNYITTNITTTIITNWTKSIITGYTTNITTTLTTNTSENTVTVLTTTNLLLPLTNWTVLGIVTDSPPGQFQFTDPQATNRPMRFYRICSP